MPPSEIPLRDEESNDVVGNQSQETIQSTDIPQLTRPRMIPNWGLEILLCVMSVAGLAGIISVLRICDQKPLPSLPFGITLNALVSFLSTITKAALTLPVTEALSQWKWNWIQSPKTRSILEFDALDAAGRGIWGSLLLLKRMNYRHYVSSGAAVVIFGIVTSPLTQQTISYPSRMAQQSNSSTTIPAIWNMSEVTEHDEAISGFSDNQMLAAQIYSVLQSSMAGGNLGSNMSCETGNCVFPRFETLGICLKTANITSTVDVTFLPNGASQTDYGWSIYTDYEGQGEWPAYNASLPLPHSWVTITHPYGSSAIPINESLAFGDDDGLMASSILDMAIIYYRSPNVSVPFTGALGEQPQVQALEFLFYSCIKELEVTVTAGNIVTNVVNSSYRQLNINMSTAFNFICSDDGENVDDLVKCGFVPNLLGPRFYSFLGSASSNTTISAPAYTFYRPVLSSIASRIHDLVNVVYTWDGADINYIGNSYGMLTYLNIMVEPDPTKAFGLLSELYGLMATAATDVLRTIASTEPSTGSFLINGTALSNETYVHIRWGWITFLAAQIALAIAFFAATVLATARADTDVRKSSLLPVLFASSEELRGFSGPVTSAGELQRSMKGISVTLAEGRLVWEKEKAFGHDESPAKRTRTQRRWWRKLRTRREKQQVTVAHARAEKPYQNGGTTVSTAPAPQQLANHSPSEPPRE